MSKAWPLVKLGEVLEKSQNWINLDAQEEYKEVTVRLWGKGVTLRGMVTGSQIAGSRRLRVHSNQFILSRIDARNGAFGLIPDELDNAIVSNDFPVFDIHQNRLLPKYLHWLSKTKNFVESCKSVSEGTTNRVRLKEEKFIQIEIPLPPLAEQQRIVGKIERLARKIEEARDQRNKSIAETAFLYKSAYRKIIGDSPQRDWVPLEKMIVDIENGWSPACHKNPAENTNWGVIKVGAVSFGYFNHKENKELPPSLQPKPQYEIKSGDFLMSRANTKELVGACALVRDTPPRLMLCDKVFRFIFHKDNRLNPTYLDHVLKSPALRAQIETGATGTSPTMKNISKSKIMQLLIPAPTIHDQIRIVRYFDILKSKFASLKSIQSQTATELDAMLPSILDKAFKGQL